MDWPKVEIDQRPFSMVESMLRCKTPSARLQKWCETIVQTAATNNHRDSKAQQAIDDGSEQRVIISHTLSFAGALTCFGD